ncbi:MAG: class I SAM-dependent methyltransferase [bacterium]|nr:class I SAM-dependent methyltransferase [bacterium]
MVYNIPMTLYEKISTYYDVLFPLKKTRLDFLSTLLDSNASILDIGCATGELPLALSQLGHTLTAIDLDDDMISAAKEKSLLKNLPINFHTKDMTDINDFHPASFNHTLCFGNTLVHLANPTIIESFFKKVLDLLKENGSFILQIVNYDKILDEIKNASRHTSLPLIERESLTFQRKYFYDNATHHIKFTGTVTLKDSGSVIESNESLYPLTSTELKTALLNAGFQDIQLFGNESKAPYSPQSPALIAVAKKGE